ncbi:PQQ-dependent sugar dehydrogenase [Polaribacter haliotis]|uniref:PQQ-dependent sugar dehydrogenase n=1 Tax=Polaribacter haliotis TaxID=1888915 RepID=A0A7L8AIX9_9FLAO|nr:PQQ-dependent sugar dehydrogenase [Polaribacter haliotis]QOD61952.1 PQQ-dependent sugar dehydrogenase [Polaribacter haliotis]
MKYSYLLLISFLMLFSSCYSQKSKEKNYEVIVADLDIPWGFTFLPDNSILITEKEGQLIHFKDGKKIEIKGMPEVTLRGQGGLLDIELHPNFKENNRVYFTYASSEGEGKGANTALMSAELKNNKLINKQVLYKATPNSRKGQHFGSRIVFDAQNRVYFSVGDRGNRDENPQDITRDGGKIYRLNDDGTIPEDNPFVNEENAKKAIFSYGHRNPQGMEINPFTNEIWSHEHGPKGGDEINIIKKGKNYGWPVISYGVNYSGSKFTEITKKEGMEQPLHYWTPSIAPSGMAFVNSDKYPNWKGNLLVGSLKFQYITVCTLKDGKVMKEEKILEGLGRVRSIEQGIYGFLYAGIEGVGIVRINP